MSGLEGVLTAEAMEAVFLEPSLPGNLLVDGIACDVERN